MCLKIGRNPATAYIYCGNVWKRFSLNKKQNAPYLLRVMRRIIHMYEFLWSTAADLASDKHRAKSLATVTSPWQSHFIIKKKNTAYKHSHIQKGHMLTRKSAHCSLYVLTDADDRAADEDGLTRERVHVALGEYSEH